MYQYEHPRAAVTVDAVIFNGPADARRVLLIQRKQPPFAGHWALPGGFIEMHEDLPESAARELAEETGLTGIRLQQLGAYGSPARDPRGRTVSVVFWGETEKIAATAGSDAARAEWFPLSDLPPLAFDHAQIVADAHAALRR